MVLSQDTLVRILQRNRTTLRARACVCVCVCVCVWKIDWLIDYKELAHADMEAKSQDLQLVSWKPREADGVVPVQTLQFENHKGRRRPMSQLNRQKLPLLSGGSAFLFYSGLQLVGQGPLTLERAVYFTQSTDSNVNLIQKHRHIQNNVWPNIWVSHGPVKLDT